jgi:hypothetical protein
MGKKLFMNKIGKYNLKVAVRLFEFLSNWLEEYDMDIDDIYDLHQRVSDLYEYIDDSLAIGGQEEIEFLIAAFYENYKACGGNWEILGDGVPPVTPKKQTWVIEQSYRQVSIVSEKAKSESYMPSIVQWDSYEGNLDWEIVDEDIRDTFDYDVGDIYVED